MEEMRQRFNTTILSIMDNKKANSGFMTKRKYDELLMKVNISKSKTSGKKPEDYQRLKRYDVIRLGDVERLIVPMKEGNSNLRLYVYFEELFAVIHDTHLSVGHGGRNRMLKELQKKYKNVTAEATMIYLSLCEYCQRKTKVPRKAPPVRPLVFQEMQSRCQVDLIDMESRPDDDFRFILVYQDDLTKFVQLRPLKTNSAPEIAAQLIDIFTIFGAPSVIQSHEGREFCDQVLKEACAMWLDLKMVHGKPIPSPTQGSIDRPTQAVEIMLNSWLEANKTCRWSDGLRFVQILKNRAFHDGIKCTPYEAMFGMPYKLGLKASFPNDTIKDIWTEEELHDMIESYNNASDQAHSEVEDDSNAKDSDPLLNEYPPAVVIKEENEEVMTDHSYDHEMNDYSQTDILSRRRQSRKHSAEDRFNFHPRKMSKVSSVQFSAGDVGDTVTLRVPDMDRERSYPRDLLAVILEIQNDEFYRLGTIHGRLIEWCTRDQFTICEEKFILAEDVPDQEVTLEECVRRAPLNGSQESLRCVCKGGCKSEKCKCKKAEQLCNSKCHGNLMCLNKQ